MQILVSRPRNAVRGEQYVAQREARKDQLVRRDEDGPTTVWRTAGLVRTIRQPQTVGKSRLLADRHQCRCLQQTSPASHVATQDRRGRYQRPLPAVKTNPSAARAVSGPILVLPQPTGCRCLSELAQRRVVRHGDKLCSNGIGQLQIDDDASGRRKGSPGTPAELIPVQKRHRTERVRRQLSASTAIRPGNRDPFRRVPPPSGSRDAL